MSAKEIIFGREMQERVLKGLNVVADAVKLTIGARGRNAFIEDPFTPKITNDGVTIAQAIVLKDKFENLGAWLGKNTAAQTNDDAGDGTSTTIVLLQALINEALKRPEAKMDVRASLEEVGARIVKEIKEVSKPVNDDQIEAVATLSAESEKLGKMIAEIMQKGGFKVPITVDDNKFGQDVEYTITEGLETKNGFAHSLFITTKDGTAEYENVHVLATSRKISSLMDIKGLLEQLDASKIGCVVFLVSDIDNTALGQLVLGKANGQFQSLVIKVRNGSDLEDMAAACGATLISEQSGVKLNDIKVEHLGLAKKITATDKKTVIVNQSPKTKEYIDFLRVSANAEQNQYDKKALETRADRLEGGVALIKVGAHTDSEREYLKHKIEDAVNATKSALDEGLVEGGGMCLYRIANRLKGNSIGEQILRVALKAPLKAIVENAGMEYATVVKSVTKNKGLDVKKMKYVRMFEKGIVDPAKVTRCAFQNALSSAATFITAGVAIADLPEEKKES